MMNFLGGVPQYIYLDNSTSLVVKADRVNPKVCDAFQVFCDHYGTTPFPVAPNKPRHKAAVEGAVRLCQERCLRPIVDYPFTSLEELNGTLLQLCRQHNQTMFVEKWRQTREMRFEEEKPYLGPLPPTPYEKSQIVKVLKVRKDSLIRYDERRYSVPSGFIGQKVRVFIQPRAGTLKIYSMEGALLAQHPLRFDARISLNVEHLPEHLRGLYMTNEMRRDKVAEAGPNAAALADAFLKLKKRVAAKHLMGLMSDLRQYGAEQFERICAWVVEHKAIDWDAYQRGIDEIVHGGVQRRAKQWTRNVSTYEDPNSTIRGSDYFKNR